MPGSLEAQAVKRMEERARCKADKMFLAEVMGWDFVPEVHQELFSQFIAFDPKKPWSQQSELKNRIILWSRGHYKSTAIQVEIAQAILNFPNITILIMRGGLGVTMKLLKEIKSYFTGQKQGSRLHILFPEFCAEKLGNAMEFTVPARTDKSIAQATVTVASPNAITTSQHYDVIFFDDLVHQKNYRTKALRDKTEQDFSGAFPLLNPGGYRYVTGTRYHHGDLYQKIIVNNVNNEWKASIKTCWGDDGVSVRFPQQPSPRDPNKLIGFTREMLESFRREDPAWFCSQYLNQPAAVGSQRFTRQSLMDVLIPEDKIPALSRPYLFVDIASGGTRADDMVIACGRTDAQRVVYLADFTGGNWPPEVAANNLLEMAMKHRPVKIMFEGERVAKVFVEYFQLYCSLKKLNVPLELFKVDQQDDAKNIRINLLAGKMNTRRFRIFSSCVGSPLWNKFVGQCEQFPGGEHDDYPDTMALMARELELISQQTMVAAPPTSPILIQMIEESNKQDAFDALFSQKEEEWGSGAGDYIAS